MPSPPLQHAPSRVVARVRACGLVVLWTTGFLSLWSGEGHAEPPEISMRTITKEEQKEWARESSERLAGTHDTLSARTLWMLTRLWREGWPAKIVSAHRSLEAQRESFIAGHSKTLRSKHLCGKAVDFALYPHEYPDIEHPFWDAKDALASAQGLLTLNAPSFRDRPHVELNEDCDWDSVALGPAGSWRSADQTLTLRRIDSGGYEGTLRTAKKIYKVTRVRIAHRHSGERNMVEEAHISVTLEAPDKEAHTRIYEVSTLTSPAHGYQRADWSSLTQRDTARSLVRHSP